MQRDQQHARGESLRLAHHDFEDILGQVQQIGGLHHAHEQHAAQIGYDLIHELAQLDTLCDQLVDQRQAGGRVGAGDGVHQAADSLRVDQPQHALHPGQAQHLVTVREQLVQQADGIAHTARGTPRDRHQRLGRGPAPFALDHCAQMFDDLGRGDPPEVKPLAARAHRLGHAIGLGGGQDEDHVGRWLLQGLQQRVEGLPCQHVYLVDHVDLVPRFIGPEANFLSQIADLVDAAVGGRVDLDQIELAALGNRGADGAMVAGASLGVGIQAVDRLCQDAGQAGLAGSSDAGEEVRVRQPAVAQRVAQGQGHVLLPDYLLESLRTPLAIQGLSGHPAPLRSS